MPRCFGSDHGYVNGRRRFDGPETDVETVREHQGLTRFEMGLNCFVIQLGLLGIGRENHDDVRPGGCFRRSVDGQTILFGFGARRTAGLQADAYRHSAVTQIQGVCVSLRAVADDGYLFCLNE